MNKKKVTCSALAALMIAGTTTFPVFAEIPGETVVIGEKAFNLDFARDEDNFKEMSEAVKKGGEVYIKLSTGVWFKNNGTPVDDSSVIPAVTYKDAEGVETEFEAKDGDEVGQGEFKIVEISAVGAKKLKVNFNKPIEDIGKLDLKIKRDGIKVSVKEPVISEDKKTIEYETSYKVQTGKYIAEAKYEDSEVSKTEEVELQEAILSEIKFDSDEAVLERTVDPETKKVKFDKINIGVKFFNQYEEEVKVTSDQLDISPSYTDSNYDDGLVTLTYDKEFRIGDQIPLNIIYKGDNNIKVANQLMTVVNEAQVASIELGEITTDEKDYKDKPMFVKNLKGAKYYVPVVIKDQYGNQLKKDAQLTQVKVFNTNTSAVTVAEKITAKDGKTYIEINPVKDEKDKITSKAGIVMLNIVGGSHNETLQFEVKENPGIGKMDISKPEELVKIGVAVELPFYAEDQYGKQILSNKELVLDDEDLENTYGDEVLFSDGTKVSITHGEIKATTDYDNDNKRKLVIKPKDEYVSITVMTGLTHKFDNLNLTAKAAPKSMNIDSVSAKFSSLIQEGVSTTLKGSHIVLHDQYGEKITKLGSNRELTLEVVDYAKKITDKEQVVSVSDIDAKNIIDLKKADGSIKDVKFTSKNKGTQKLKLVLKNVEDPKNVKVLDQREFKVSVVNSKDIEKYDIELSADKFYTGSTLRNDKHDLEFDLVGYIEDDKVAVNQTLISTATISNSNIKVTTGAAVETSSKIALGKDSKDEFTTVDTKGNDKEVTLTVALSVDNPITKKLTINSAAPVSQTLKAMKGSDEYTTPYVRVEQSKIKGFSFGEKVENKTASVRFVAEDQYEVELIDYCTYAVGQAQDKEGKELPGTVSISKTGVVSYTKEKFNVGDEFVITVIDRNSKHKTIKVIAKADVADEN